ncbi:MAG TPA: PAS domain S-box protein [Anaeromyxobacteraceae bacterium]|nr:PAS domain S-box protein [Anaeromyxobacteraceae bacterium]
MSPIDFSTAGGGRPPEVLEGGGGKPCLVWVNSSRHADLGRFHRIEKEETVIGRGAEADVEVDDPGVSRRHAMVVRRPGGECVLVDLQSRNGTFVNGLRVRSSPLREGDKIQLGTVTALRFSLRESLEDGEERLRQALAAAGIGAWEWNARSGVVTLSGGAERLLDPPPGTASDRPRGFWDLLDQDDARRMREALEGAARQGRSCEIRCRVHPPDGKGTRWLELRGEVFRDEAGSATHVTGTLMDVTVRRAVEQELRRYALVFESLSDAVVVMDLRGEIVDWNGGAARLFGWNREEALGRRPGELLDPRASDELTPSVLAGVARAGRFSLEAPLRRKGGGECLAELTAAPLRDPEGRQLAAIVVARDVGERKQLEARLLLADRMASLGTLAAGVAHEINNPLAFVMGNLQYLQEELAQLASGTDPKRRVGAETALRDAREGAARIRAIVADLATFSRGNEPEAVRPVDVNRALEFALKMAERQITARARLERRLGELPPVLGAESRLSQVFLNLLVNAAQSIPEGNAAHHQVRVSSAYDPQSGRVAVEIADTGQGIEPEDQARIFDPFFTTKPVGRGTGLGLSVSHSIVTSLGGEIAVESAPGRGTTMRVLLPAAERAAAPEPGPRARVLVVDDEPLVGAVVQRLLSPQHEVLAATSAREAMALLDYGARFDLLLCDLVMPEVSGMELLAKLQASHPEQARQVVFMTAGAFTPGAQGFVERHKQHRFLAKPIDLEELESIIAETLAARQGAKEAPSGS